MKKSVLKKCEEKLVEMKKEILSTLNSRATEGLQVETDVQDETDIAQDSNSKSIALSLVEKDRNKLNQINQALERLKEGTYGYCIDSDEEIEEKRLLANPLALRSITSQEAYEKEMKQKAQRRSSGGGSFGSDDD